MATPQATVGTSPFTVTVSEDGKQALVRMKTHPPTKKVDGTLFMIAGSAGYQNTSAVFNGHAIQALLNAGYYGARPGQQPDIETPEAVIGPLHVEKHDGWLEIQVPLGAPQRSKVTVDEKTGKPKGGKKFHIASTGGYKPTDVFVNGQRVRVSILLSYKAE